LVVALDALGLVAGIVWARRGASARLKPTRIPRAAYAAAAIAVGVIFAAWTPLRYHRMPHRTGAAADAPNVVLVLVDALRADRLSINGYHRPTTPFIDRLAQHGATFINAYSHGNRTIVAMPSLFTSIYPSYARTIVSGDWTTPLPDSQTTIAEVCRDAGYTTVALMSNPFLRRPFGLAQGFDRVEEFDAGQFKLSLYRVLVVAGIMEKPYYAEAISASANEVTDAAVAWLERVPKRAPYFCYVHYMDVHHPYDPPSEFEQMFRSGDWLASIDPQALFTKTYTLVRERKPYPLDDAELTRLSDLYDGCVRYVDSEIAHLVEAATHINERPTVVVITSDHGDEFQEHGGLYHNNVVIEELIRVPLVVWRSDRENQARRVTDLVRHIDVLPTVAEVVGARVPEAAVGRSLVPLLANDASESSPRASVAKGDYCSAMVEPGWKLMRVDTTGVDALFDLVADPSTRSNVAQKHDERFTRMQSTLDAYLKSVPQGDTAARAAADAETLRRLQALGYIN
jgi:arylsulfatase A-like enzyme